MKAKTFKVWLTVDNEWDINSVELWLRKPRFYKSKNYFSHATSASTLLCKQQTRRKFGKIPKNGECLCFELTIKEVKDV